MDIKALRYFVAAVEERSIQGAATRVNIAQPALSRRLRDLEAELGSQLFARGPRGVLPTAAGAALYRHALTILEDVEKASQQIRLMGLEQGRPARFGLVQTSRKFAFLPRAFAAYRADRAHAAIDFSWGLSSDLGAALGEGRLDMTLLYGARQGTQTFNDRLIHREKMILAVHPTHRLAGHGPVELAELVGEPLVWLSHRADGDDHADLRQQCRRHGFEPLIAYSAGSHIEQVDLTTVNAGICFVPATVLLSVPRETLMFRPLANFDAELHLRLAWRSDLADPELTRLLGSLHSAIDDHQHLIRWGAAPWARLDGHDIVVAD